MALISLLDGAPCAQIDLLNQQNGRQQSGLNCYLLKQVSPVHTVPELLGNGFEIRNQKADLAEKEDLLQVK